MAETLADTTGFPRRRTGKHRAPATRIRRLLPIRSVTARRECDNGFHQYADPTPIGGGILRSACAACGNVSLDLREANVPIDQRLFTKRKAFAGMRRRAARPWPRTN